MHMRSSRLGWPAVLGVSALSLACANGRQSPSGSTGGGGTTATAAGGNTTSTAGSGGGGAGGGTTTSMSTGGGGAGGGMTTSTAGSGAGGTGGTGGGTTTSSTTSSTTTTTTTTGPTGPFTKLFAILGGGSNVVGNVTDVVAGSGFATPWMEVSNDGIGLAVMGMGVGVCVMRTNATGELRYATWNGNWNPGFAAAPYPLQDGQPMGYVANGSPSLAASQDKAFLAYLGTDLKYYYGELDNFQWAPGHEVISAGGKDATGSAPPAIAVLGTDPTVAYVGADGAVYDQTRKAGTWQAPVQHGLAGQSAVLQPALVALASGPELLLVYQDAATHELRFTARAGGVWSDPAPVAAGAVSDDPVSVAPLAAGGAVLAYRGKDNHLHTSLLSADGKVWSAPVTGVSGSDPALASPPAVALGAKGADAELLYLDANYTVYWARLQNGAFGMGSLFGSAGARLAVATGVPGN
jgi:hypothetical protein